METMIQHEVKHLDQKQPTDPYGDKMLGSALLPKKLRIISMHIRYGTQKSQRFKIEIIQY
jgi:hypothetical protein